MKDYNTIFRFFDDEVGNFIANMLYAGGYDIINEKDVKYDAIGINVIELTAMWCNTSEFCSDNIILRDLTCDTINRKIYKKILKYMSEAPGPPTNFISPFSIKFQYPLHGIVGLSYYGISYNKYLYNWVGYDGKI